MRITFFCPISQRPVGGIKVIYRLAELCDELLGKSGEARVLHPNQPWVHHDWFESRVKFSKGFFGPRWVGKLSFCDIGDMFSHLRDIVILPETWVRKYGVQLAQRKIPFAILVQNGYMLEKGNRVELDASFAAAKLIFSVSEDTSACIRQAFPFASNKIRRLWLHVDSARFKPAQKKENLISYMPRKLPHHAKLWNFFTAAHLPNNWKTQVIDGQDEQGVATHLARSKIFLSMGYLEGLGLPPIEAALAGNLVLGYTGEGGREYWQNPLFHEIPHGDLLGFARKTLELLPLAESLNADSLNDAREVLANKFSEKAHRTSVENFLNDLIT